MVVALEFAILLGYDGQLKQNSDMEKELFQCTIEQLNKTKMTKIENALMWLYVKSWGAQGQHVIDKDQMWNFGGDDLEEAIMGIAYPRKKKTENKDEGEKKEDLVESLRKLILEKFNDKKSEFYEWSQTIHDEVGLVMDELFVNCCFKAMENIPMQVTTKTLAFTDPTAVANDRVTGETSIIAFRAAALKGGQTDGNGKFYYNKPGI